MKISSDRPSIFDSVKTEPQGQGAFLPPNIIEAVAIGELTGSFEIRNNRVSGYHQDTLSTYKNIFVEM